MRSPLTTLCYIEYEDSYLMMHRIRKKQDMNQDKWIGIGGHFEKGESPEDCLKRETLEETGLQLQKVCFRGIVTFVSDQWDTEYMCLYTAEFPENAAYAPDHLPDCPEGVLEWVPRSQINQLPLWEGDRIFFKLLEEEEPFFSLKLRYEGELLAEAVLNGIPMKEERIQEKRVWKKNSN